MTDSIDRVLVATAHPDDAEVTARVRGAVLGEPYGYAYAETFHRVRMLR